MGGKGSGRLNKTDAFIKNNSDPFKTVSSDVASVGNEVLVVPNHSGDHSAGRVTRTPITDYEIANKKYVDDQNLWEVSGSNVQLKSASDVNLEGDLFMPRESIITWGGDNLELLHDNINFGTGDLIMDGKFAEQNLLSVDNLGFFSNTARDASGTWEPSLELLATGIAQLTNTTQGNAADRRFDINMTSGAKIVIGGLDMNTSKIVNVVDPTADQEAATKKYVDDNAGGAPEGTAVLSTGEGGGTKFLREDGDGTCSWQAAAGGGDVTAAIALTANTIVQGDDGAKGVKTSTATVAQIASNVTHTAGDGSDHADVATNSAHVADVTGDPHNIAADTLTFTNKTIDEDGAGNAITNLANASIKAGAAIDATKIADGSVTSTEFQYINTLSSNAQTQITAKLSDMVDDTSPELGGELDCGANTIGFTQQTATGDGTTTIDWKLGNKFKFTFGAQNDTFTFTAPTNPCNILLMLVQDGTGSRTATWPATVKWPAGTAPTLTTAASSVDIVAFYYDGTNYFGVESLAFS